MKNFISAMFFAITALLDFSNTSQAATQDLNFNDYVKKYPQLTDKAVTKLLAKNFSYKISRKEFEDIESQFESGNKKFSPITLQEYEN